MGKWSALASIGLWLGMLLNISSPEAPVAVVPMARNAGINKLESIHTRAFLSNTKQRTADIGSTAESPPTGMQKEREILLLPENSESLHPVKEDRHKRICVALFPLHKVPENENWFIVIRSRSVAAWDPEWMNCQGSQKCVGNRCILIVVVLAQVY